MTLSGRGSKGLVVDVLMERGPDDSKKYREEDSRWDHVCACALLF